MDIRQTITDRIISIMEQGTVKGGPRWTKSAGQGLPCNAKTGEPYKGINVLLLWAEAAERQYSSNLWLTYRQAEAIGGHVRKGERSVMCVYYSKIQKHIAAEQPDDQEDAGSYLMCKPFWLFNGAQIDGLPDDLTSAAKTHEFKPLDEAEQILINSGAKIHHGFDSAFYIPSKDQICLPVRERFTTPENYYATALHELTHWTAHESRLNRQFGKRFGDDAYAFEELVAELGAAFTVGHVGMVDATIENHAAYLQRWIHVLKSDKRAIFTAASQAAKAADFILSVPLVR
jgi:antirestriction protein ArdC